MGNICKICGSDQREPYFDGDGRVIKCLSCGVGFLSQELVNYNGQEYYSEGFNYSRTFNDENRLGHIRENSSDILKILEQYVGPNDKKLLDVGAHTGIFVQEASEHRFEAMGIELNKQGVKWAKEHGINVEEFNVLDFNPENKFDVITMFHVLEHLEYPVTVLKKIYGLLNDEGFVVIEVPNSDSYLARKDGLSWKFIALEHLFYFSERSLVKILEKIGFKIIARRKRNFELNQLNIKKLLRYIIGPKINRDRFKNKSLEEKDYLVHNKEQNIIRKMMINFLVFVINLLGRQDHILIIAQKT